MTLSTNFVNIDLLSVGITIAAIGILGLIVFLSNSRSATNRSFLFLSISAIAWSVANYASYQVTSPHVVLVLLRLVMFFAVWYSYGLFQFFYVFPRERAEFPRFYKYGVIPLAIVTSIVAVSSLVIADIKAVAEVSGQVATAQIGKGIALFGGVVIALIVSGIGFLFKKNRKAEGVEKKQMQLVLIGAGITFILHIIFNFILPAFFDNTGFIPFGAMFIFPMIAFTTYAIFKHKLLNIKVIATEVLTFVLAVVTLLQVIVAEDLIDMFFGTGIFLLTLIIGFFLIRSVRREVEQKEKLQKLSEDLEKANEELKRTEKLKAEFFSFAAHQVKSPMAVIKGYATLIGDGTLAGVPADKIVEIAKKIGAAASRTLAMVNNLLDMRKIEEGKMVYSFEELNVVPVIRTIVTDLETIAKDKGLALTFEASQEEVVLNMDIQKFTQVIQNLIDNAVKYTDAGWVKVSISPIDGKVIFAVSDSGRGISKDFAANMFTQFSRDPALSKDTKGTGLGLFIAKQIVEAHGGRIWASSEGEGSGSTFSVEIPQDNKAVTEKMGGVN